jgi:hypothetical protein
LAPFEEYTQLVSACGSPLSVAVLIHKDVMKKTKVELESTGQSPLDELKRRIAQNIDKRLKVTHAVLMATLMDPSTNSFVGSVITEARTVAALL